MTDRLLIGDQVPIPTLPLVTTKPPCGVVVPMPTLLLPVVEYIFVPEVVHPPTLPGDDHVTSPLLSLAVNTYPLTGVWPLMVNPTARTVPVTSSAWPGAREPIPTLP